MRPGVSYQKWRELLSEKGIVAHSAANEMKVRVGEAVLAVVFVPNDSGRTTDIALRLTTNGQTFLLAPALTKAERQALLGSDVNLDADVAVLPNEFDAELLERVTTGTVILFVGRRPQDKPTEETLRLLGGVSVLRTDREGTINFNLDGHQTGMRAEK